MKIIFLLTALFFLNYSYAQELTIKGIVKTNNNNTLAYVNIGIKKENIGTVSDENGEFSITLNDSHLTDSLTFSYVGYQQLTIKIDDILKARQKEFTLFEQTTQLEEVLLSGKKLKTKKLGTTSYVSMVAGYVWSRKNIENRDINEHAKYLNIKKPSQLLNFNINLFNVVSDSAVFRLNFYTIKNETPDKRIKNIVLHKNIKEGWNKFDLTGYDLKFDKPVFISFEYIPIDFEEKEPFRISGQFLGKSIKRNSSLGTWDIKKGISMAMYVEIVH